MKAHVLNVTDLHVCFGDQEVLRGVTLRIDSGECVAITGPNGSGKTTLLRALSGLVKPQPACRILLGDRDVTSVPPWRRSRLGMVHVLEGARVFTSMTVEENLIAGTRLRGQALRKRLEDVLTLFCELAKPNMRHRLTGVLSGGEREMVVLGRAAMQEPKVLLLDSPFLGAGAKFREGIIELLNSWRETSNLSIVLVDHDLHTVHRVASRVLRLTSAHLTT